MEIPSPALWNVDLLQNIHDSEETQGLEYTIDNPDVRTIYEYLEDQ